MATAREHVEQIRKTKFSIGGEPNPLTEDLHQAVRNLSAELYAKDVHFLMELIQNAEDNEYLEGVDPSLEFVVTSRDITGTGAPATLLIFNNETGFTSKNIDSICSVGRSTKKGNRKRGYIGEKGIGFKSVFLITAQPYVFSNGYQIRFSEAPCPHCNVGYIVPEWVETNPTISDIKSIHGSSTSLPTTTIILPLKPDKVKPVKQQLSNIHPEILLFLTKIKRLSVREVNEDPRLNSVTAISISSETNFVTRKNIDAESYALHLSADDVGNKSDKECAYHIWRQRFPVKQGHKVERRMDVDEWVVTLAFPTGERLNRGMNSPGIYAFLPTEMVTNFPFIIQADFILASSRENIPLDNKWNRGILDCVSCAFINAFTSLVKDTEAPTSTLPHMFRFLPINEGPYEELNAVRESIRQKLLSQSIVPSESYSEQKFFNKPSEVGRILPAFWNILNKARAQGVALNNISSHGCYILCSSFDKEEYDLILKFMGVEFVDDNWYSKCIQGSNIVMGVSEDVYLELLIFIAQNWNSSFQRTNIKNVSLLKYVDPHGKIYLKSVGELSKSTAVKLLRSSDPSYGSWMINWNKEFRSATEHFFLPVSTQKAIESSYNKQILFDWLLNQVNVRAVDVFNYGLLLSKSISNDTELTLAYTHFLYHSFSRKYLSEENVRKLCKDMPLIDSYGQITTHGEGVLLPAIGSKWLELIGSNPWRNEGYVELGKDYLQPASYVGLLATTKELVNFLKNHVPALDVPRISAPNAVLPTVSAPLTKTNVFLLLDWIRYLRQKRAHIPERFLTCILEGSWLRTSLNGSHSNRPPSKSFMLSPSMGYLLQEGSELVDIPLIDQQFYGDKINDYKEELRMIGVMFESEEACRFIGKNLMTIASSSNLTRKNVLSILKFIRFLRNKYISPEDFVNSIKGGRWMRTNLGDRRPGETVLYDQTWKAAIEVSNIPLIDEVYYGAELNSFKEELQLIGVAVKFDNRYQYVVDNLQPPARSTSLGREAFYLILECLRYSKSPSKLVNALKGTNCLKTNIGLKYPSECYVDDPEWGSLLQVFGSFPLIDENYYGSKILKFKNELKQIGVIVDFDEASKRIESVFRQQASLFSIRKDSILALLKCYKRLKSTKAFPSNLMKCLREVKWLRTRLGVYKAPTDCILFAQCWESICPISLLPFIDDSENQYGDTIHEYKKELQSLGVKTSLKRGAHFVMKSLCFPHNHSSITPENVYSLLDCIRIYKQQNHNTLDSNSSFMEKIDKKWLKTCSGYSTPAKCLLFNEEWVRILRRSDGPFIDEDFYGPKITSYKDELSSLGVIVDVKEGCSLLADYLDFHSCFTTICRICSYLFDMNWEPDEEEEHKIWIPSGGENGEWVSSEDCVIHDKYGLLGSGLHVLELHYEKKLLSFFSKCYGVKINPSVEDYCKIWKTWEVSGHQPTFDESCAFWGFIVKNWSLKTEEVLAKQLLKLPVYLGSDAILLVDKHDAFIADDLHLKELFESAYDSLFVWYPKPSLKSLPRIKLLEIYSKIGVRTLSASVRQELSLISTGDLKQLDSKEMFIAKGLLRLILGFLAEAFPKMEADARHDAVRHLLEVTVLETQEPIKMGYSLTLSTGETLNVKARQMLRWERQISKLFVQKLDKNGGHKNVIEYASNFSEEISWGLLWENEDQMHQLSELIRLGFLVEFHEEAVRYLMNSKNLQIYLEDEEFLSSTFPHDLGTRVLN